MLAEPTCHARHCKHFLGVRYLGEFEDSEVVYCSAFPDGIPSEIAYGDNLHLTPFPGDHGIQFKEGSEEGESDQTKTDV